MIYMKTVEQAGKKKKRNAKNKEESQTDTVEEL